MIGPFHRYTSYLVALPCSLVSIYTSWRALDAVRGLDSAVAERNMALVGLASGAVTAAYSGTMVTPFAMMLFVYARSPRRRSRTASPDLLEQVPAVPASPAIGLCSTISPRGATARERLIDRDRAPVRRHETRVALLHEPVEPAVSDPDEALFSTASCVFFSSFSSKPIITPSR